MNNKNEYLILSKNVSSMIGSLNDLSSNIDDLTKNFNKGLNGDYFKANDLIKVSSDIAAIKTDLNDKVLPELKKKCI